MSFSEARSRTAGVRSAVTSTAGRSAPSLQRSAVMASMPVALVEMIVGDHDVGPQLAAAQGGLGLLQARRRSSTAQPQPVSRVVMPFRIAGSLSMHSTAMPASGAAAVGRGVALRRHRRQRGGHAAARPRTPSRGPAATAAGSGGRARARCAPRWRGPARARGPPGRPGRAAGTRWNTAFCLDGGMPSPVSQTSTAAARAGAGSRPGRGPCGVYLIALETRFCSSRRSSRRSERTVSEQGMKVRSQALLARHGLELQLELVEDVVDAEAGHLRLHRPGIEPRDVEQGASGSPRRPPARRRRSRPARRRRRLACAPPARWRRGARR